MKKISLTINGMVCNGCENRVKNALKNISGVTKVNADHKTGKITIMLNKELEKELLLNTIKDLGYEIVKED